MSPGSLVGLAWILGASWAGLGLILGGLGGSWVDLGWILGIFGESSVDPGNLGGSFADLSRILGDLGRALGDLGEFSAQHCWTSGGSWWVLAHIGWIFRMSHGIFVAS